MTTPEAVLERHSEEREFNDHCELVAAGAKLPSLDDLIQGCPFHKDHLWPDADAFARVATERMGSMDDSTETLLFALAELSIMPGPEDFVHAAEQLQAVKGTPVGDAVSAERSAARCHFYAAVSGHPASAKHVAAYAISQTDSADRSASQARLQARGALAWRMVAVGRILLPRKWTRETASEFLASAERSDSIDSQVLTRIVRSRAEVAGATGNETAKVSKSVQPEPLPLMPDDLDTKDGDQSAEDCTDAAEDDEPRVVVMAAVGNPQSSEGKRVASEFKSIAGTALRLVPLPDLARVRRELVVEFPHAQAVTTAVLGAMPGLAYVRVPPTVFVGPPGSGKSTYAVRLAELLGLPAEVFPCGGVSDSGLAGTPRRWSTGEPSVPVSLIRAQECASPAIILDEIEKVATCRNNGSLLDALLGLLEPRTAARWRDPYVEAAVDLSHVVWLATANSVDSLPRALLDRFQVLAFPSPGAEHVLPLAAGIMAGLADDRGLDPRWFSPLDGVEIDALSRSWSDGSIRTLGRLVSAVICARERFDARH